MQRYFYIFLLFLVGGFVNAQNSQERFGKNRVQHENFKWKYISTTNFNVYYYVGGQDIAYNAARYAEDDFKRITDLIGYAPYSKTTIIVYNSISDLQQSNIGLEDFSLIGGETQLIKSKLEVAFPGNHVDFKERVTEKISTLLINMMLFGGSLKDRVQNSYLLTVSDWFVKGAAAYAAHGWSTYMYDKIEHVIQDEKKPPSHYLGDLAEPVGQSFWYFIAEKYGRAAVSNILNLTRIIRNEETAISNTLGVPFSTLVDEWRDYYIDYNETLESFESLPGKKSKLKKSNARKLDFQTVKINPSGTKAVYSYNYRGVSNIFVYDFIEGKRKKIKRAGHKVFNQPIEYDLPLLSWKNNTTVVAAYKREGKVFLWTYDVLENKREKKKFKIFEHVNDMDISPDGKTIVFSAVDDGRSDIYTYDIKKNTAEIVTKDLFDDLNPVFLSNEEIIFSSNRINDTLRSDYGDYEEITDNYDLFLYHRDSSVLRRLINSPIKELGARVVNDSIITFKAQQDKQSQLYDLNLNSGKIDVLTHYKRNILDYDYNQRKNKLAFIAMKDGKEFVFQDTMLIYDPDRPDWPNPYDEMLDTAAVVKLLKKSKVDSTQWYIEKLESIDIRTYKFESDTTPPLAIDKYNFKLLPTTNNKGEDKKIYGPYDYKGLFGVDYIITSLTIDPLRGSGILFENGMSDMFGNHKVKTGILAISDLRSSNFYAQYEYLKNRVDHKIRYDRQGVYIQSDFINQQYTLNQLEYSYAYPLMPSQRVSVSPFFTTTRYTALETNTINREDTIQNYLGFNLEYVFDNTIVSGLNMLEGMRAKVSFRNYTNTSNQEFNFSQFNVDIRRYQKIHREMVLAARFSFGSFMGNSKKNFLIGGMDNWLFPQTINEGGVENPLYADNGFNSSNLLFVEYATALRGFDYNKRYGHNYLLFNLEYRLPIVRYITTGPISSTFFRNLQLITFYDFGTAWSGESPFNQNNEINTVVQDAGPFRAQVINYKNPFLAGYGFGLRSMLLGYYVKLDVAWGVEDFEVTDRPKFYLTLGYDF